MQYWPEFRKSELAVALLFAAIVFCVFLSSTALVLGAPLPVRGAAAGALHLAAGLGGLCVLYGLFVEPWRLSLRRIPIESSKLTGPLRAVHLSDLHIDRWSSFEENLLERVRGEKPDLILLTGDYTSSRYDAGDLERTLAGLAALAPVYACLGNSEGKRPVHETVVVDGLRWVREGVETVEIRGRRLSLGAALPGDEAAVLSAKPDPDLFAICLYHYPDLVPALEKVPYDLMLSGHTHGGQIRLPWIGALFANSKAGRRYARGVFRSGSKTAFVSQGIGCESYGLPRMRFLCPPEIAVFELGPENPDIC
jgi:predicted MPP superfamily phosphohydrolase